MPIDVDSERWDEAALIDPIKTKINQVLRKDKTRALSISEIDDRITENDPFVFPNDLVGEDAIPGAAAARQSAIVSILSRMYWQYEVGIRYYSGDAETEPGIYVKSDGTGINPVLELEGAVGWDNDSRSLSSSLSNKFDEVEDQVDEEVAELEDRVQYLESRVQEELGTY